MFRVEETSKLAGDWTDGRRAATANHRNNLGRNLRAVFFCLIGVAALISASASVPIKPGSVQPSVGAVAELRAHIYGSYISVEPASGERSRFVSRTCLNSEFTAPMDSVGHRASRRVFIFVEDTTPPSSEALKTARLQIPVQPQVAVRAASPALKKSFISPSNRQRAP